MHKKRKNKKATDVPNIISLTYRYLISTKQKSKKKKKKKERNAQSLLITKTCIVYNFDPLKPQHVVNLGFTGVYIIFFFLISAQKHRLLALVRTTLFFYFC